MNVFRQYRYIVMIILVLMGGWGSIAARAEETPHHYYDLHQNSLEQYDAVWDTLHTYYGEHLPQVFAVVYTNEVGSRFDPNSDQIRLSVKHLSRSIGGPWLVAHESSHIGLHHFTAGASILEQFRFFDEGLANIMGAMAADTLSDYKQQALNVATEQYSAGNVSFEKVQQWSSYYGTPGSGTVYAYDVGASFNFFVMDTYGEERFWQFLEDIGTTRDLGKTSQNVFNLSMNELEREWLQYLAAVEFDPTLIQPQIVDMSPAHDARNIPTDLEEIVVRFNTDMKPVVCIRTPCQDTGLCYKNAYWKDSKTFAVKIDGSLQPDFTYPLSLGVAGRCSYKSKAGVELPVTPWTFTTGAK